MSFDADLAQVESLLDRRGRVSLRAIKLELGADEDYVAALADELVTVHQRAAFDSGGTVLVSKSAGEADDASLVERRLVTFLLCDVVSSTELAARLDPEDLRNLMLAYQQACGRAIQQYGGHISQWIGDGVVVYFGYPDAHDDDAVRAVAAGLDIIESITELDPAPDGTRLSARVGIHSGPVVVGGTSGSAAQETSAFGRTPNICARIEAAADPDSVFISDQTRRLVEGFFTFDDRGTFELKGVEEPMQLFSVTAAREARSRFDVVKGQGLLPLVGRSAERSMIEQAWEAARRGEGSALLIEGEPGIGKSRLAHYARELAGDDTPRLEFHGSALHVSSPLHAVVAGVRAFWSLAELPSDEARLDTIRASLEAVPTVDEAVAVPFIAELLGVAGAEAPLDPTMTPQRKRAITLTALVDAIAATAEAGTLVIVAEDLHWFDPTSDELLRMLLGRVSGTGMMVVLTARPEYLARAQPLEAEHIALEPLGPAEAAELARLALPDGATREELIGVLADKSDGVPLFIEELARSVGDTPSDHDAGVPAAAIPTTLQSALQARLDRLSKSGRHLAQMAAAFGRRFDRDALADVSQFDRTEFATLLGELERAQLVRRSTAGSPNEYEFRHALIQEIAAESVLHAEARTHHGAIADALEHREAAPEVVAFHANEAGQPERAVGLWIQAGVGALGRSAILESLAHFTTALDVVAALPESVQRDQMEVQLQVLRAIPLTLTRGWASVEVGEAYRRADELCGRLGDAPELYPTLVGLLTYDIVRGAYEEADVRARRNEALALEIGDPSMVVEAYLNRGTTQFYLGNTADSLEHLNRAVDLYDPKALHANHIVLYGKDPGAVALLHAGLAEWLLGRPDKALESLEASVALTDEWVHPFSRLWAQNSLCALYQMRGEVDLLGPLAAEVVAAATEQGFPNWLAQCLVYLGWATAAGGDTDTGLEQIGQGLSIWQMTGASLAVPYMTAMEGDALRMAGRLGHAQERITSGIELAEKNHEGWWLADLYRLRGEIAHAEGDTAAAGQALSTALEKARARDAVAFELRAATALGRLAVASGGDREAAAARISAPLERIEGGASLPDVIAAREVLAELA